MPKMPDIHVEYKNQCGDVFKYNVTCSVTSTGEFRCGVPDDLTQHFNDVPRTQVTIESVNNLPRISGSSLAYIKNYLYALLKHHAEVKTTVERIIAYGFDEQVSYVKQSDGRIFANGCLSPEFSGRGGIPDGNKTGVGWKGSNHATRRSSHFRIGLAARVFDKVTHSRGTSTKVEYKAPQDWANLNFDTYGQKLNAFTMHLNPESSGVSEMPYTEDAAEFFYNALTGMCTLADKLQMLFDDEDRVKQAIEARSSNLLTFND